MFIELLFFTLAGILLGIITGLTPGIHVNTISMLMLPFTFINPYMIATAIIAMSITHTFFDFVPSILLGAPDPDTSLSVLPGHQMLLEGRGIEAIYLTVVGGIGSIFAAVLLLPVFLFSIPFLYAASKAYIVWLLVGITIFMILLEKKLRRIAAAGFVFLLSGILGLIIFNTSILPSTTLFFPAFTGLFGISTMLLSLPRETGIPEQNRTIEKVPLSLSIAGIIKGVISGSIMGVLPALGAAQATVLTQEITRKKDRRDFLVSIGAINTIVALFSLISLYTISKPRSGAAVAIERILPGFGFNEMLLLVAVTMVAGGVSSLLLMKSMKGIVALVRRINYRKLTFGVIGFLVAMTAIFTGWYGLLLLAVSTSIGLLAPLFGIKRSTAMGVLMLPLILFYIG